MDWLINFPSPGVARYLTKSLWFFGYSDSVSWDRAVVIVGHANPGYPSDKAARPDQKARPVSAAVLRISPNANKPDGVAGRGGVIRS